MIALVPRSGLVAFLQGVPGVSTTKESKTSADLSFVRSRSKPNAVSSRCASAVRRVIDKLKQHRP